MAFSVTYTITDQLIADVLDAGFHGGIDYWGIIKKSEPGANINDLDFDEYTTKTARNILSGGRLIIVDAEDNNEYILTREKIEKALERMSNDKAAVRHINDIVSENYDCITGDALIQFALFNGFLFS